MHVPATHVAEIKLVAEKARLEEPADDGRQRDGSDDGGLPTRGSRMSIEHPQVEQVGRSLQRIRRCADAV